MPRNSCSGSIVTTARDRLERLLGITRCGHYIDLDRFKPINDTFGHAAGDALLKEVAARLRSSIRETDTAARIGGDEFVVLQVGITNAMDAALMARRICASLSAPYLIADQILRVGSSIGIAVTPEDGIDPDQLMRKADHALYGCKARGRGQFAFFCSDAADVQSTNGDVDSQQQQLRERKIA